MSFLHIYVVCMRMYYDREKSQYVIFLKMASSVLLKFG
jgi:hypothetical protein